MAGGKTTGVVKGRGKRRGSSLGLTGEQEREGRADVALVASSVAGPLRSKYRKMRAITHLVRPLSASAKGHPPTFLRFHGVPVQSANEREPEYGVRSDLSLLSNCRRAGCAVQQNYAPRKTELSAWGLGHKLKSVSGVVVSMRWSGENWNALGSSHLDTTSSQLPAVTDNCHCTLFLNCAHAGGPEIRPANCKP